MLKPKTMNKSEKIEFLTKRLKELTIGYNKIFHENYHLKHRVLKYEFLYNIKEEDKVDDYKTKNDNQ
jgi:hypothetical protein